MDKAKLPRSVAEAIDKMRYIGVASIMACITHWDEQNTTTEELVTIHDYYLKNPYLIAQALVNGYEVEETPEDKVRKLFKEYDGWAEQAGLNGDENLEMQWIAARNAIVETLSILNIKIEGVNA